MKVLNLKAFMIKNPLNDNNKQLCKDTKTFKVENTSKGKTNPK